MLKNSSERYGSVAKFFHWLIALLIFTMLFLGYLMQGLAVVNVHQIIGLTILTLVACRLIWKLFNPYPQLPPTVSKIEKIGAKTAQAGLYICMFGMPLSGWTLSTAFGTIPHIGNIMLPAPWIGNNQALGHFFQSIHNTLAIVLMALIFMHVMGALKHQFIDKDPTVLKSMLPSFKKNDT